MCVNVGVDVRQFTPVSAQKIQEEKNQCYLVISARAYTRPLTVLNLFIFAKVNTLDEAKTKAVEAYNKYGAFLIIDLEKGDEFRQDRL